MTITTSGTGIRGEARGMRRSLRSQKSLKRAIPCRGIGLHSGRPVSMTLKPAGPDHGIVFRRTDVTDRDPIIPARYDLVVDTTMCTVLSNSDGVQIGTVEHLMAAFAGCEIDNALVEIDAPEVPVMDGSSEPFVFLIECAGVVEQNRPRKAIEILKPVRTDGSGRSVTLSPADTFAVSFEIDFDSPVVAQSSMEVRLVNGTFKREIAKARTFGFLEDVERLRSMGLALGGSLENAVVVDGDRVLNEEGLRYEDEFIRHKVLDCIGDLYLAGAPIIGRVDAIRSGHRTNNEVLHQLFADPDAFRVVDAADLPHFDAALPATA